jgi:hypothetical protein
LPFKCNLQSYNALDLIMPLLRRTDEGLHAHLVDAVGLCTLNQADP